MEKKIFTGLVAFLIITTGSSIISADSIKDNNIIFTNDLVTTDEINETQLKIEFRQIVGVDLNITIINTGEFNATGVYFGLSISGGILGLINETTDGILIDPLLPGEELIVTLPVMGLGMANITAKTYASNAEIVTVNTTGLVIFNFVLTLGN